MRSASASTISELVWRFARTTTSRGSRNSVIGRPRRSNGTGFSGNISSRVRANSSAWAVLSGKIRITRPSRSAPPKAFSSSTRPLISVWRSSEAVMMRTFAPSATPISTGSERRSPALRASKRRRSKSATVAASVFRTPSKRKGGSGPSLRRSTFESRLMPVSTHRSGPINTSSLVIDNTEISTGLIDCPGSLGYSSSATRNRSATSSASPRWIATTRRTSGAGRAARA